MTETTSPRYGMVIDLDRCTGCGACMVACAVENNVPPAHEGTTPRTGLTWMRVAQVDDGRPFPETRSVFVPVMCQQCDHHTPCVSVCPQNAVEYDEETGIVAQVPARCLGCRYCMTACPYHARYFNWWDPQWPAGMEQALNPDVSTRMRGVVEKCNFCHGRLQAARAKAAAASRPLAPEEYQPACVEACPTRAILFGDLNDPRSAVSAAAASPEAFRLLDHLGTEPKVRYRSRSAAVREALTRNAVSSEKEQVHG